MGALRALRVHRSQDGVEARVETLQLDDLSEGPVEIRTAWSGINYKDALAVTGRGRIARKDPLVPGIDLAGTVETSEDSRYKPGQPVVVTGWGMGEGHDGGFAEYARVPGDWIVPVPEGLDPRGAMIVGTAGFTAGLALMRMEQNGQRPEHGPILVTGASGGVGSFATLLLSRAGYTVTALTGKPDAADYLRGLGAESILAPDELEASGRPLDKARWAGVVDAVGGATLAGLLPTVQPFGTVAAIGLAGGTDLPTTVMPFILRGVSLLGIESVYCPATLRLKTWERIAGVVGTDDLEAIGHTAVGLEAVPEACERLLDRGVRGRVLVRPDAGAP